MAEKRDYYEVLGVARGASDAEIKSAYRKKAKECHPDLHPGDKKAEEQFKELNEAYEVLSDEQKRAKYDQFGHAAFDQTAGGDPFGGGFSGFSGFGDIFDIFTGGGFRSSARSNGPMKGEDITYAVTLSFDEAAFGVQKEIMVPREENCSTCGGSGAKAGTSPKRCTVCGGTGQVRSQQQTMFGAFATTRPCTACHGTGKIISDPCPDCRGTGRIRRNKRINVDIPAGIDDGQTIRISGEGEGGLRGGPAGDLYVTVSVRDHRFFRRNGFDLLLNLPIPYPVAVLGGAVNVPTLKETAKLSIPAGTQNGTTFRMRGKGIKKLRREEYGDILVTITIDVPKKLTEEQKKALETYGALIGTSAAAKSKKTIFSKVKDAFD